MSLRSRGSVESFVTRVLPLFILIMLCHCEEEMNEVNQGNKKCFLVRATYTDPNYTYSNVVNYKYDGDTLISISNIWGLVRYENDKIVKIGDFQQFAYDSAGRLNYRSFFNIATMRDYFTYNDHDQVI